MTDRRIMALEFPARPLPAGGRVTLRTTLTERGALLFRAVFVGPETLTACVLERLVVDGVDRLALPLESSATWPGKRAIRADVERVDLKHGRVVALATQPIELEIRSCHDRAQTVGAVIIGEDVSAFPPCFRPPMFVASALGVERLACGQHAGRPLQLLEDWAAIRRAGPPELRNAACGCLYWRAADYPVIH